MSLEEIRRISAAIPMGRWTTYQDVGELVYGHRKAMQAVGDLLGRAGDGMGSSGEPVMVVLPESVAERQDMDGVVGVNEERRGKPRARHRRGAVADLRDERAARATDRRKAPAASTDSSPRL